MIYFLLTTNLLTLIGLVFSIRRFFNCIETLDEVTSQIEESLDIIDESYSNLSRHLKSPVMFDDPAIVSMINDVKKSRQSLLLIANKISSPFENLNSDADKQK